MNILGVLLFIGLMVFTIYQIKGLVVVLKERKKAQQNDKSSSNDNEKQLDNKKDQIQKKETK